MALKKTFAFLFFFFFLLSCGKENSDNSSPAQSKVQDLSSADSEILDSGPVPMEALTFSVNVKMIGFTPEQEAMIYKAIELIKQVVSSEDFRNQVLNKKYNGRLGFFDNEGLSNKQIYKKILLASEVLNPDDHNNTMDLELELYQESSSTTIGYTYPNVTRIWINKKFLDQFDAHNVADNLFHEWLHKLGFSHDTSYTASRRHTVPYAIGYLVRDLARSINKSTI